MTNITFLPFLQKKQFRSHNLPFRGTDFEREKKILDFVKYEIVGFQLVLNL